MMNQSPDMTVGLLSEWCDKLLLLQVDEKFDMDLAGGILCPACQRIHGRSADAIYPLMSLAKQTGEDKYVVAAKRLFTWAVTSLKMPNGSFKNDATSMWEGTTVFFVIQLAEALMHHADLLDDKTRISWEENLKEASLWLDKKIRGLQTNSNYLISSAAAFALVGEYFKEQHYLKKAHEMAHRSLRFFTPSGLIYGEGWPHETVTSKGCRPIDIGYSVEESLSNLAIYAESSDDQVVKNILRHSLKEHLNFMLEDGGWDNSWGSRSYKWSYWGSRTSDGCQIAYGLYQNEDPRFAEVVFRNTQLLKRLTVNGLLAGGPMFESAGEPICVHHTFCHAKALAFMIDHQIPLKENRGFVLPMEEPSVGKHYQEAGLYLIHEGTWRATVSEYDFVYQIGGNPTGGALTFLSQKKMGPIFAASTNSYQLVEENNMQLPKYYRDICQTPRIEWLEEQTVYRNIHDLSATLGYFSNEQEIVSTGHLRAEQTQRASGKFEQRMSFKEEQFLMDIRALAGSVFHFPIIASQEDKLEKIAEGIFILHRQEGKLLIEGNLPIGISHHQLNAPLLSQRIFNPVGGFQTIPFWMVVGTGVASLKISVMGGNKS